MLHSKFLSTSHVYITHSHMHCHGYIKECRKHIVLPLKQLSWHNSRILLCTTVSKENWWLLFFPHHYPCARMEMTHSIEADGHEVDA